MSVHDTNYSHILIATEIETESKNYIEKLKPARVVSFLEDDFKLEHAKSVIAEAYLSESNLKYIVLAANSFNIVSQNSLLKLLEEPPKNIRFIIISPSKSTLLPTIRSRLPIIQGKKSKSTLAVNLSLSKVDYLELFGFLKENARIKKNEAKLLLEAIYFKATVSDKLILNTRQLESFDKAYRLLELNSRPQSVLALVLMGFVGERQ